MAQRNVYSRFVNRLLSGHNNKTRSAVTRTLDKDQTGEKNGACSEIRKVGVGSIVYFLEALKLSSPEPSCIPYDEDPIAEE